MRSVLVLLLGNRPHGDHVAGGGGLVIEWLGTVLCGLSVLCWRFSAVIFLWWFSVGPHIARRQLPLLFPVDDVKLLVTVLNILLSPYPAYRIRTSVLSVLPLCLLM